MPRPGSSLGGAPSRARRAVASIGQDAGAYFERHGSFVASRRDLGYSALLLASVWKRLGIDDHTGAHALVGRGFAVMD